MLYEEAKVNVTQTLFLILSFIVRHSLSQNAVEDLLQLLRALLPKKLSSKMLMSYHHFKQRVLKAEENIEFIFYYSNKDRCSILTAVGTNSNNQPNICSLCSKTYTINQLKKKLKFFF